MGLCSVAPRLSRTLIKGREHSVFSVSLIGLLLDVDRGILSRGSPNDVWAKKAFAIWVGIIALAMSDI